MRFRPYAIFGALGSLARSIDRRPTATKATFGLTIFDNDVQGLSKPRRVASRRPIVPRNDAFFRKTIELRARARPLIPSYFHPTL